MQYVYDFLWVAATGRYVFVVVAAVVCVCVSVQQSCIYVRRASRNKGRSKVIILLHFHFTVLRWCDQTAKPCAAHNLIDFLAKSVHSLLFVFLVPV